MMGRERKSKRFLEHRDRVREQQRWDKEDRLVRPKRSEEEARADHGLRSIRESNKRRDEEEMSLRHGPSPRPRAVAGLEGEKRKVGYQEGAALPQEASVAAFATPEPPALAEALLVLFADEKYRDDLVINYGEQFDGRVQSGCTAKRARRLYWASVLRQLGPQSIAFVRRQGFSLVKWGGWVSFLIEVLRQAMH